MSSLPADYEQLLKGGPQHLKNGTTLASRRYGVAKFDLSGARGGTLRGGGTTQTVYYIPSEHDPKAVIEEWLTINGTARENLPDIALHQRISAYGSEWKEASRELLDDLSHPSQRKGESKDYNGTRCPNCGKPFRKLPSHLPCDEEPSEQDGPNTPNQVKEH